MEPAAVTNYGSSCSSATRPKFLPCHRMENRGPFKGRVHSRVRSFDLPYPVIFGRPYFSAKVTMTNRTPTTGESLQVSRYDDRMLDFVWHSILQGDPSHNQVWHQEDERFLEDRMDRDRMCEHAKTSSRSGVRRILGRSLPWDKQALGAASFVSARHSDFY